MSYIEDNMVGDEQVLFKTKPGWAVYISSIAAGALAVAGFAFSGVWEICGVLFALAAIYNFIRAFILMRTTEVAVTSRRIIGRSGILSQRIFDMQHDKIESVIFRKGISEIHRTIILTGSGGTSVKFEEIKAPQEFRKAALEAIDQSKRGG